MVSVVSFERAMHAIRDTKNKHLLLGNGFSIALKPDIFTYGSLYENADFSKAPHVTKLFDALKTQDFEVVIKHLQDAATVVEVYRPSAVTLARSLRNDAAAIKDALVTAIAKRHPDRPYDVKPEQYAACRAFLSRFGHIFTLNYDVLLYWTIMQSEVDALQMRHDDGFRHPEDDPTAPWVSWQQGNSATVSYLHGALHLFDAGSEITKYTWSKTDKPIVDQIRAALDEEKYPLFVSEGTSASKKARILHSGYLHKAHRSFEGCCGPAGNAIIVHGHSLDDNDDHVLRCIAKGNCGSVAISLFGNAASVTNKAVIAKAEKLVALRGPAKGKRQALDVIYYDAASAKIWGQARSPSSDSYKYLRQVSAPLGPDGTVRQLIAASFLSKERSTSGIIIGGDPETPPFAWADQRHWSSVGIDDAMLWNMKVRCTPDIIRFGPMFSAASKRHFDDST